MAALAAAELDAHLAKRKVDVVVDDQQVGAIDLVVALQWLDGIARPVHEGPGNRQQHLAVSQPDAGQVGSHQPGSALEPLSR